MLDLQGYGASILAGTWVDDRAAACASLALSCCSASLGALAKLSPQTVAAGVANGLHDADPRRARSRADAADVLRRPAAGEPARRACSATRIYVDVNPFTAGVLTIGFIYGAYMTETFRGAILAVPRGQLEAGQAFGMSRPAGLPPHPAAADDPPRAAGLRQQLAGPAQDDGAAVDHRPRRHGAHGQSRPPAPPASRSPSTSPWR